MAGTHEDALLIVELSKLATMSGLEEAARVLWADDFDPDTADVGDPPVQKTLYFFETVGTLVKNGLLNRDLVYDWVWVSGAWSKVAPAAERMREKAATPELFENFESLAAGQRIGAAATA
jgi:hypothetical protein